MALLANRFNVRQYEELLNNTSSDQNIRKEKQAEAKQWLRDYRSYVSIERSKRKHQAPKITNATIRSQDSLFIKACELAGITPTDRQASKWRNDKGIARKFLQEAQKLSAEAPVQ